MKKVMLSKTKIREGMVVAGDVFTHDGTMLIPQRTQLTPNHIIKLTVYNVDLIPIYVEEDYKGPVVENAYEKFDREMRLMDTQQEKDDLVNASPEFIAFSKQYAKQLGQVEDQLNNIVLTGHLDLRPLYDLINDMLATTASNEDLFSFMCRMKSSEDVTYSHSMNVSMLASILGKWLDLPTHTTLELALAGLLHDIGKVRVNQMILKKNGKLTDAEFEHIKQHTTLGYEVVANTTLPLGIKHAILMHHEKMNGAGYPLGLSWNRIHDYAKIISIVDIYDAMTAERPYHRRFHPFHVIHMFEEECKGILDTEMLYVFLEHIAHNFLDDLVMLNDGSKATIIFIHHRNPSRPIVQLTSGKIIDLLDFPDLSIRDFL